LNLIKNRPNNSEYFKLRFIVQIQYVVIKGIGSGKGKQYIECGTAVLPTFADVRGGIY